MADVSESSSAADRARLEQIRRELANLSLQAGGFDYKHLEQREDLENEATAIRAKLGLDDDRPPLRRGSSRTGWILLTASVIAVLGVLALLSTMT